MMKQKIDILLHRLCGIIVISVCMILLSGCNISKPTIDMSEDKIPQRRESIDLNTVLLVTGEYAPYTTEQAENKGFFTELVEAALKENDISYRIEFYPWARCSEMVENGEAWATFPYTSMEKLPGNIEFSKSVYPSNHLFYYYKGNGKINKEILEYNQISDFSERYVFGGSNDYWYGNKQSVEEQGVEVEWANDTVGLVKMLHSSRIDFLIEDELVCDDIIHRLYPDEVNMFVKLPKVAKNVNYHLVISKEYPNTDEIKEQFNNGILELMANGRYEDILNKNNINKKLSQ